MSPEVTTLLAAVGAVGAMLAVLVPVIRAQGAGLRREIDALRTDQAATRTELRGEMAELRREVKADIAELRREVRADIAALRSDLHGLTERVARIEGSFSGPWRPPANGSPAPSPPPEETT